jgi:RNA-directed DNA polymerase
MKESYTEGPASHSGPESCAGARKDAGEALTGAHMGGVLSRDNRCNQGADDVVLSGRQHAYAQKGEGISNPARSETSSTYGNSMRENREIPYLPFEDGSKGRAGKVDDRNPAMNRQGKSDNSVVPARPPNEAGRPAEEVVEGSELTKENVGQQNTCRTQGRESVPSALERIREAAIRNKGQRFNALFHHVTEDRLKQAFLKIKRNAAPGADGITWEQYNADLDRNVKDLYMRLQRGAYQAKPSRRAYIPKADGRQRPLGIAALEDKIVQRAVTEVLNAIYEVDFLGFSYGFRPGRRAHIALDALAIGIRFKKISWILDADIRGYFDSINHDWMIRFLEHRIADKRILRLIRKWLKAGVIEDGEWKASEEGSPQGSSISPLLANIYLHYVLDLWVQQWRRRQARGDVIIVRWADDFVVGFQYEDDASCFKEALRDRLGRFSLALHPEKTRLIRFGRFARRDCGRFEGKRKPETFNFLGFTHYCGVNLKGKFMVGRITQRKRLTAKLHEVKAALRERMHQPIAEQGNWLASVIRGYFGYHAIPGNWGALGSFRTQCTRLWYKTLRRRSQKTRLKWDRMKELAKAWLPPARILHPWPEERFGVFIRGRSRMR